MNDFHVESVDYDSAKKTVFVKARSRSSVIDEKKFQEILEGVVARFLSVTKKVPWWEETVA